MAEFPAMPLWTDAYLGDTRHLTTFEHGAYLLLLIVSWRQPGCCLPDDDHLLSRYTGMTRDKWAKIRSTIEPFFTIRDGHWHQARLQNELQHLQSRRKQQVEAGIASAIAKSLKRGGKRSTPVGLPLQQKVNGTSTPIPIPTSSNELEVSSNEDSSSPDLKPEHVFEFYQEMAQQMGLPVPRDLTPERRQLIKGRIAQHNLDDFHTVFANCRNSAFLRGDKGRSPLTADWLFKKGNFQKTLEGNYAN